MRADVLNLVQLLANNSADPGLIQKYYDDEIINLAGEHWLTNAQVVPFTAKSPSVNLPGTLLDILAVFYDNYQLSEQTYAELRAVYGTSWRNVTGKPEAYTLEAESAKTMEVAPSPDVTSPAIIPIHGQPLGWDYGSYNGAVIFTELRNDVMSYLELPLALRILAAEFTRESDHMDLAFASSCRELGTGLLEMLK